MQFNRKKKSWISYCSVLRVPLIIFIFCACLFGIALLSLQDVETTINEQDFGSGKVEVLKPIINNVTVVNTTTINDNGRKMSNNIARESINNKRRQTAKEAFVHAYGGYKDRCLGKAEVRPITGTCHEWLANGLGLSIMDSLDTILLMGLTSFYENATHFLRNNLDWDKNDNNVSVFEVTIRCLGGLLTAFDMTKDNFFLQKATELADRLLPAFDTDTGYPLSYIRLSSKVATASGWASGNVILADIGSIQLEFAYLSYLTGNPIYNDKAYAVYKKLMDIKTPNKLYPVLINPHTGSFSGVITIGGLGDSFYEYILKYWLVTNKVYPEMGDWFFEVADALIDNLAVKIEPDMYFMSTDKRSSYHTVEHLTCFAGGMFALGSLHTSNETKKSLYFEVAEGIAKFCYNMYRINQIGLASDSVDVHFNKTHQSNHFENGWKMRPEAVETWFILYRLTKNETYRDWGWELLESLNKYTKVKYGYTGLRDPSNQEGNNQPDDIQQSYFLAETLKYIYLLFSPDDVVPLTKYVFNTEAHPIPIFTPINI